MKIQLAVFAVLSLVGGAVFFIQYVGVARLVGIGVYKVRVQLPQAAGLYPSGNVTYRGIEVGRVTDVHLTDSGVEAVLTLKSDVPVPSDLTAQVHSVSAIGEQYVALIPRSDNGKALRDGDVIPAADTTVPPEIGPLLDATTRGIQAIPHDNLKTVVDESYAAFGGLGPEIAQIVQGSTQLAIDARKNLEPITTLIDQSQPVLDSQSESSDAIHAWASHLANVTQQLADHDDAAANLLSHGAAAGDEARALLDRIQPTLPVLLANLVSVNAVAIAYQPALEQVLVLVPQIIAVGQAFQVAAKDTAHPGVALDFKLNVNLPPPCTTGFLPATQIRPPAAQDSPPRTSADLYCRIPQDSPNVVRGARNLPCLTRPGKRAPTVKLCESDEQFVPLNDGWNWKGDPNATLSGQGVPQLPPGAPAAAPPPPTPPDAPAMAITQYDPATGSYVAPDGRVYTQADLVNNPEGKTWQSMLTPPTP